MQFFDKDTIEKIRKGYFTAVYFNRTKEILLKENKLRKVTMQIFQKNEGCILAGVEEVTELLRVGTGYFRNSEFGVQNSDWIDKSDTLEIMSLEDGDRVGGWKTVMHIKGPYAYFAHLESLYLGILARRTIVATNVRQCVDAALGKQIIFFADRFDHFLNQEGDGYAAKIGGASAICTDAMSKSFGGKPVGTIPHALIAVYGGDTIAATEAFARHYPDVNLIALVDFKNDCVKTSLEVAHKFGKKLWGVRLDTASDLIDKSLEFPISNFQFPKKETFGVNPMLVRNVREALDREGFHHVKIVVSGGFTPEKIEQFTNEQVQVDAYGVGSALVKGSNDFTADIVEVDGKRIAKTGREYRENNKMNIIKS